MRKKGKRHMQRQSGQSLFEMALMLPFLLLLALGVIELGRFAYIGILVGNAAHAGAFYGATLNTVLNASGIQQAAVNDFVSNGQPANNLTVNSHGECGCDSSGTISSPPGYTLQTACSPPPGTSTPPSSLCPVSSKWAITVSVTATGNFCSIFNVSWGNLWSLPGYCPGGSSTGAGANPLTVNRTSTMRVGDAP